MNETEFIKRYGKEACTRNVERAREWRLNNPEKEKANMREKCRKGGKYYEKKLVDERTGLQGERNRIRSKHAR